MAAEAVVAYSDDIGFGALRASAHIRSVVECGAFHLHTLLEFEVTGWEFQNEYPWSFLLLPRCCRCFQEL